MIELVDEIGLGHLEQGRFKSFPIQTDDSFHTVVRYVERNPLRANLVARAEQWPWSSLGQASAADPIQLSAWPVPGPAEPDLVAGAFFSSAGDRSWFIGRNAVSATCERRAPRRRGRRARASRARGRR